MCPMIHHDMVQFSESRSDERGELVTCQHDLPVYLFCLMKYPNRRVVHVCVKNSFVTQRKVALWPLHGLKQNKYFELVHSFIKHSKQDFLRHFGWTDLPFETGLCK